MPSIQTIATGLRFPEGPVWVGPGEVVVTEIQGPCVTRCTRDGTEVLATTGGGANGLARAGDGTFFLANNGGLSVGPGGYWFSSEPMSGRIQRIDPDGTLTDLITDFPLPDQRPNDICFGPDGRLYFTDPHNWDDLANLKPGRVWRAERDGSGLEQVAEVPWFPNGLAFGPDGETLYVAQSILQTILAFPRSADGLGEPREHCKLPTGFPDGFCFAADGSLYVCGSMGHVMHVFDADGTHREEIPFPDGTEPTNCCIGDGRLYVTLSGIGELVALDLGLDALPLYG